MNSEALNRKIEEAGMPEDAREKAPGRARQAEDDVPHVGGSHRGAQLCGLDGAGALEGPPKVKKDLGKAQEVLDADHYGLDKVKDRILEYLAVQAR